MKIIGVAGQLASGKDTLADYLVEKLNKNKGIKPECSFCNFQNQDGWLFCEQCKSSLEDVKKWQRLGFANAVKNIFANAFGVTREFIEEWKRKDEAPPGFNSNVRKGLQYIGDGFRQIKSDIWIETAFRGTDDIIISDVRYVNEAKAIKERGGITILLWRPGFENNDPNPSESQIKPYVEYCANYCQEGKFLWSTLCDDKPNDGLEYFDFFLKNDGDKEVLQNKVDTLLMPFLIERGMAHA